MSLPVQIGQTLAFLSIFRGLCECNRGIAGAACAARLLSKGCQGWAEIRAVCALRALAVIYRRRWAADDSATVCLSFASLDGFKPLIDNGDQMTCQPPVEAFLRGEIRIRWHTGAPSPVTDAIPFGAISPARKDFADREPGP